MSNGSGKFALYEPILQLSVRWHFVKIALFSVMVFCHVAFLSVAILSSCVCPDTHSDTAVCSFSPPPVGNLSGVGVFRARRVQ